MTHHEKNERCPSCGRWVNPDKEHAFFGPTINGTPANDLDVPNAALSVYCSQLCHDRTREGEHKEKLTTPQADRSGRDSTTPERTTAMREQTSAYGATCHRDGTVTFWDVYRQEWRRSGQLTDRTLATLDEKERKRVSQHTSRRGARSF